MLLALRGPEPACCAGPAPALSSYKPRIFFYLFIVLSPGAAVLSVSVKIQKMEYRGVGHSGHHVLRLPTTESELIGILPPRYTIKLSQVADNWGKLHTSMASILNNAPSYRPHDINTEGWIMLSDPENGTVLFEATTRGGNC